MTEDQIPTPSGPNTEKPSGIAVALFDYIEMFVYAAVLVILLMTLCFRLCEVSGPSMNKTLENGEKLIVSDLFYTPETGDIIVFHQTNDTRDGISYLDRFNEPIVKRVIATGGQYVRIDYDTKQVWVSNDAIFDTDDLLNEDYAFFDGDTWRLHGEEYYTVPEGHLFVMGDNRNNSSDSRSSAIGFVDERRVLGRVLCRISPFTIFGKAN